MGVFTIKSKYFMAADVGAFDAVPERLGALQLPLSVNVSPECASSLGWNSSRKSFFTRRHELDWKAEWWIRWRKFLMEKNLFVQREMCLRSEMYKFAELVRFVNLQLCVFSVVLDWWLKYYRYKNQIYFGYN